MPRERQLRLCRHAKTRSRLVTILLLSFLTALGVAGLSISLPIVGATDTTGGAYTPLQPTRLLDTRVAGEAPSLTPGGSLSLPVVGTFGSVTMPPGATAVALNVTTTKTTAPSFLTVFPTGVSRPEISNLNWSAGDTVSNLVIVGVGAGGAVSFYNESGTTDLVVDLEGYFAPEGGGSTAGSYVPLTPARITDTRPGSGEPNAGSTLQSAGALAIQVEGQGGVPSSGVAAVAANVTVTNTTSPSFLTVYPGPALPTASNVNWTGGETLAHRVIVLVDPNTGQITVYNSQGQTDVVVDVTGYFTTGSTTPAGASLFTPISPTRVLDTRLTRGPLGSNATLGLGLADVGTIAADASAVVTNVTVTNGSAPSFLAVYPSAQPTSSDVNWVAGETVPNLTVATLNNNGTVEIYNSFGSADVVVDAFGYFAPLSPAVEILTSLLAGAQSGQPYSSPLVGEGGSSPYSFAVVAGQLPAGMTLSASGIQSGTPPAAGSSSFTVQMTDSGSPAIVVTDPLSFTVALAPNAVLPGIAGSAAILNSALTANGTPILDAAPGTRLYLTVSGSGTSMWSSTEPETGYPGATTITDALAFPNSPDYSTIMGIFAECNASWGLPDSQMGYCENLPDYRGECSFWAVMNWTGSDPTAIQQNGGQIAIKAVAESALTGATSSSIPVVGELVSWQPAGTLYGAPYGHAAVVVGVNPANFTYVVEEMNFGLHANNDWDIDVRVVSDNAGQLPSFAAPPGV